MALFRLNKGVTFRVLSSKHSSLCVRKTAEAYESSLSEVCCAAGACSVIVWGVLRRRTIELLVTLKFVLIGETYTVVTADRLRFFPNSDWFVPTS